MSSVIVSLSAYSNHRYHLMEEILGLSLVAVPSALVAVHGILEDTRHVVRIVQIKENLDGVQMVRIIHKVLGSQNQVVLWDQDILENQVGRKVEHIL